MNRVAVIGDSTSIMGFKPLGVSAFSLSVPEQISEIWPQVLEGEYAVVLMTEPVFAVAQPLIKEIEGRLIPAVVAIPSTAGTTGAGRQYIKALMERAVGTSLK